jgi:uncharacterized membrane protein YedE/YeeE
VTIDWASFTPWPALGGGVLIGVAAVALVLLNGRIAGVAGILGGLLRPAHSDVAWRTAFIAGLILAYVVYALWRGAPTIVIDASYPVLIAAGLLVGIGVRYGSGCTSGHGVCGISRFSPRSIVATVVFMTAGFATVFLLRHVIGA